MLSRSRKTAYTAVFTAIGLILSYLESFIVIPVRVPGIRLGLANIATVIMIWTLGPVYGLLVSILRVVLANLLFGSPVSFIYGFSGAVISFIVMLLMRRLGFSIYGVSVAGAVVHNCAQIIAASILVGSIYVFTYLPVLTIAGVLAGLIIGFLSYMIISRLKNIITVTEREG